jgi:hypothetical protein
MTCDAVLAAIVAFYCLLPITGFRAARAPAADRSRALPEKVETGFSAGKCSRHQSRAFLIRQGDSALPGKALGDEADRAQGAASRGSHFYRFIVP